MLWKKWIQLTFSAWFTLKEHTYSDKSAGLSMFDILEDTRHQRVNPFHGFILYDRGYF